MKSAIVLCSGGLDSCVAAYFVKKKLKYGKIIILFFNYKQRTLDQERESAKRIAKELSAEFMEIALSELAYISASLINKKSKAKKIKRKELKNTEKESNKYYVPCRNIVFLTYAMALAESLQIKDNQEWDIFTGFKNEGKEAYPDTTKEFVKEINKLKGIGTKIKGKIIAPLIIMDKEDIIRLGEKLGVKLENTYSCYIGSKNKESQSQARLAGYSLSLKLGNESRTKVAGITPSLSNKNEHCGTCLACRLRQEAFYWANIKDKTRYKEKMRDYRKA
jgi:7-cyano-7-deazaguanine synthase